MGVDLMFVNRFDIDRLRELSKVVDVPEDGVVHGGNCSEGAEVPRNRVVHDGNCLDGAAFSKDISKVTA